MAMTPAPFAPISPLFLGLLVLAAVTGSLLLTGSYLRWAVRHQVLDRPNDRSSHVAPTPRGGGVGIVILTFAVLAWGCYQPATGALVPIVAASLAAVALISWWDDLRHVPAKLRLGLHVAVGIGLALTLPSERLGLEGAWHALAIVVVTFWIVGHINCYNFMDGIDGIAGAQSAVVGFAWMTAGAWHQDYMTAALGATLGGASLGFLRYNWSPARIFLGDVGFRHRSVCWRAACPSSSASGHQRKPAYSQAPCRGRSFSMPAPPWSSESAVEKTC
jgi:Fuc2NAc and GlcNAc transferase